MNEREMIIGVLRELGRRLWIARTIRETAFGVGVVLFYLACFQLVKPALSQGISFAIDVTRIAASMVFAAVFIELLRRSMRRVAPQQAAAHADRQAHLKDELKSAHWFLSENFVSPFAQLQLTRAAATAARLDLAALAPHRLPANALVVAGLGVLLGALIWMSPQSTRSWEVVRDAGPAVREEAADLRALLKSAPDDAELAKLDLALRKLQQAGLSVEERKQALADARDAIDQANMEASVAREGLAELADKLKADPKFADAARALDEGRLEDAMALVRKLKADAPGSPQKQKAESDLTVGAIGNPGSGPASERDRQDASGAHAEVNQDAMARIMSALDQAKERLDVQSRVNTVKRRMEASLTATSQRSQLTASQFDTRVNAPNPTPSPDTGNSTMRGGSLFRQAAVARETDKDAREGSQTGDASGESPALPLEGVATRRLDAQLKLETLARKDDLDEETNGKGEQDWFYSATREQKSSLQVQDVRSRAAYDREGTGERDRVPIRQKAVVKNYFLNLHESEKK